MEESTWSDESIFEHIPTRRVWIRGRKNERYHPDCINSIVKHGGGKLQQVWGCMAANGVGTLEVVKGRQRMSSFYATSLTHSPP